MHYSQKEDWWHVSPHQKRLSVEIFKIISILLHTMKYHQCLTEAISLLMNPKNKKAAVFVLFLYKRFWTICSISYANQCAFVLPTLKSTFLKAINFQECNTTQMQTVHRAPPYLSENIHSFGLLGMIRSTSPFLLP